MDDRFEKLSALRFGEDVAEYDTQLDDYFLRTNAFWSVVRDEADLILGGKGSGKSAIARYLSDPTVAISPVDDVDILPAFNIRGSILFRKLTGASRWNEIDFRAVFLAYMVALVGNYIVESYGGAHNTTRIENVLQAIGLRAQEPTIQRIWSNTLERFALKSIDARVRFGKETSGEIGASASPTPAPSVQIDEIEALVDLEYQFFEAIGHRCWVVFDRLDEAFPESAELEGAALRGLLQAHLDLSSFGPRLKSKLFLRLDLWERITTESRFVNSSHIRTIRIIWDSDSILHMIALRVDSYLGVKSGPELVRRRVRAILPDTIDGRDSLVWILLVSADGFREFNPRNVLYLLRSARLEALQSADRVHSEWLLDRRSLQNGYKQLSVARLQDLLAESPSLRESVDRLRGQRVKFSREQIALALDRREEELAQSIARLHAAGLLRVIDNEHWAIPAVYRPAMFRDGLARVSMSSAEDDDGDPTSSANRSRTDLNEPTEGGALASVVGSAIPPQKRTRGKSRSKERGRDELVPTNQPSELEDDADVVDDLTERVGGRARVTSRGQRTTRVLPPPRLTPGDAASIGARRAAVHQARALAESGDVADAFRVLCPDWMNHSATACVAADLAFRSADPDLMVQARRAICRRELEQTGAIVARRLVLAIALGEPDKKVLTDLRLINRTNFDSVIIGLIKMVSQAPSQETAFWRDSTRGVLIHDDGQVRRIRVTWPILAASRLLAIYRFWREADPGRYLTLNEIVTEVFPPGIWELSVAHIEGYLYSFAAQRTGDSPPVLPYQILSLAAVLESQDRLSGSLRKQVTEAVAMRVKELEPEHLERFVAWSDFSSIGRGALLEGVPDDAPELLSAASRREPTPTERLHSAEVAAHRTVPANRSEQQVDPRVLEAVRQRVMESDGPIPSASAAYAALRIDPGLARSGWAGAQRFGRFVLEYLPELRYVALPSPGWVLDPARHGEDDLPQSITPRPEGVADPDARG